MLSNAEGGSRGRSSTPQVTNGEPFLESAVAWVRSHVPPVTAVTADQMTRPAHLTTPRPISGARVVMGFRSLESALAAAAPAGLHDLQTDPLRTVL